MEGTRKASEFAPEDVIGSMPDSVITNILNRLPLQDAVRTGVLSRNWRFKWTMLSQLVFDDNFFNYLSKTKGKNNHVRIISRILFHLRGDITKFVMSVDKVFDLDVEDLSHWLLLLSRKGIQDLTLTNTGETPPLKLSTHLFSCLELKHLKLYNCCFNPPPSCHGFPNLLSLELRVEFEKNNEIGDFFTRCPLLEILSTHDLFVAGKVDLDEIAKLKNLKVLSFSLCEHGSTTIVSSHRIHELVGSLPKLQELDLDFKDSMWIDGVKKTSPTAFPCLRALRLSRIFLNNCTKLSCAFELIRSSPNLRTLEITAASDWNGGPRPRVDYSSTQLLQLRSVMFECLKGSENELWLIKFLLACSPFLKKIVIYRHSPIALDQRMMFAKKLLMLHRASPVAEIDLFRF